jgi:hypothetical protein
MAVTLGNLALTANNMFTIEQVALIVENLPSPQRNLILQ